MKLSINMTDVYVNIYGDSIRDQIEGIEEEDLLEKVRVRTIYQKRRRYEV